MCDLHFVTVECAPPHWHVCHGGGISFPVEVPGSLVVEAICTNHFCICLIEVASHPNSCHLFSIYESVSIFLVSSVCSLDSTVSKNIWYLSLSDWFISLSILFSRSIHAVTKGNIFLFYSRVVFHCVNVP